MPEYYTSSFTGAQIDAAVEWLTGSDTTSPVGR